MYLFITYPPNEVVIQISENEVSHPFAEIRVDILEYNKEPSETTEAAIVRLLANLEDMLVEVCKRHDKFADDYTLHEEARKRIKKMYPFIQSSLREAKRSTASQRERMLNNIKKELHLK